MSGHDPSFDAVFGTGRGHEPRPECPAPGSRRQRYGPLWLRSYNPATHTLVKARAVELRLPERTGHEHALAGLNDAVARESGGVYCWALGPGVYDWECGCGGDALSGLMLCATHETDPDAPSREVVAYGKWLPVPAGALPENPSAHRRYLVARSLLAAEHAR